MLVWPRLPASSYDRQLLKAGEEGVRMVDEEQVKAATAKEEKKMFPRLPLVAITPSSSFIFSGTT